MNNPAEYLIILGGGITALGVVRSAASIGLSPIVLDIRAGVAFSSWKATSHIISDNDDDVLRRCGQPGLNGNAVHLIATSDAWLRFVRHRRSELESLRVNVLHLPNRQLDLCLRKSSFAQWCEQNNFATPSTRVVSERDRLDLLPYPLILRPDETRHESNPNPVPKSIEIHDETQLRRGIGLLAKHDVPAVVSESLLGRDLIQYSVPFARCGNLLKIFVAEKLRPGANLCSVGTLLEVRPDPDIEGVARTVIEKMDYFGIGELEILKDRSCNVHYLIELNPRPWTQFSLSSALGFDFLGTVLGRQIAPAPDRKPQSIRWINFTEDLYTVFSRKEGMWTRGAISMRHYLTSLLAVRACAVFSWSDPWPAIRNVISAHR